MSTAHTLMVLAAVWLATAACMFGLAWQARGWLAARQLADADADRPVPYQVTRQGWYDFAPYGPPQGAADPAFEAPGQPDAMAMAAAAYQLGQDRSAADDVHREAAAIWAEVEANPDKYGWRIR